MDHPPPPPPLPREPQPGRYRHYRGGEYEVVGLAHHSETLEPMVVYRALRPGGGLWVRPAGMFVETVPTADGPQPRFARE
jgi:hypothetical protein